MKTTTTIAAAALLVPFALAYSGENHEPLNTDACATELEVNLLYSDEKEYQASQRDPCLVLGRVRVDQIVKTVPETYHGR